MNIACRAAVGLVVFLPAAVPLPAEAQSGQITGVVVDATGGVLPGASVTLRGGRMERGRFRRMRAVGSRSPASLPASTP